MERSFMTPHGCFVNNDELPHRPLRQASFFDLTKEAFWILILLSSLGIWAAAWAAAATLASAWLQ